MNKNCKALSSLFETANQKEFELIDNEFEPEHIKIKYRLIENEIDKWVNEQPQQNKKTNFIYYRLLRAVYEENYSLSEISRRTQIPKNYLLKIHNEAKENIKQFIQTL